MLNGQNRLSFSFSVVGLLKRGLAGLGVFFRDSGTNRYRPLLSILSLCAVLVLAWVGQHCRAALTSFVLFVACQLNCQGVG